MSHAKYEFYKFIASNYMAKAFLADWQTDRHGSLISLNFPKEEGGYNPNCLLTVT